MVTSKFAKVVIDSPLPHLDHAFDYLIPGNLSKQVKPGVRVRVPFRNRRVDGYVVALSDNSQVANKLLQIETLVSPEQVLTAEILQLCRTVAHRNVGNLSDVIRAAVPPRHARAEKQQINQFEESRTSNPSGISELEGLSGFMLDPKIKTAIVNFSVSEQMEHFVAKLLNSGVTKTIILLPDQFDVDRVVTQLESEAIKKRLAILTAQQSAEKRYTEFLKVLRGNADLVIGTRSAVFAPMNSPNLIMIIDDGDDLFTSPQAPYWNAREVALWRSEISGAKVILTSHAMSVESAQLINSGLAIHLYGEKSSNAKVKLTGDQWSGDQDPVSLKARLPAAVFNAVRTGAAKGTVLISLPRKGYLPLISCANCRTIIRCGECLGVMGAEGLEKRGRCFRCGNIAGKIQCLECNGEKFRALISGIDRTAEEIGKAFPRISIKTVTDENRNDIQSISNQIILAMPGMEPAIAYSGVVVLDSYLFLARPEGNARIRFLRHLMKLRSLLSKDGEMVVVGESDNPVLQAFLRNDESKIAFDLLQERTETKLNPFARTAEVRGDLSALRDLAAQMPNFAQVWGPVSNFDTSNSKFQARSLVSVPRSESETLVKQLRAWVVSRSANRGSPVMVRIDPDDL